MTVGELIKSKRIGMGMTLDDVGKFCGVDRSYVHKWETGGIKKIKLDKIQLLAKCLCINPLDLMVTDEVLTCEERMIMDSYRSVSCEGKKYLVQQAEIARKLYAETEKA